MPSPKPGFILIGRSGRASIKSRYILVVVGKAAEIKEQLAKFGVWMEKKITDPGF